MRFTFWSVVASNRFDLINIYHQANLCMDLLGGGLKPEFRIHRKKGLIPKRKKQKERWGRIKVGIKRKESS